MLGQSWRKFLPDLEEEDLQGFLNEELSKPEILDLVCVMRDFENIDENNADKWLQSDVYELGFQHDRRGGYIDVK
jgi:hypothetical protein